MPIRVLLTGAAGFAGSHIADEIVRNTDWHIVALDALTYAGHMSNLDEVPKNRMTFICHDFAEPLPLDRIGPVDYIIHNGAETHVTNSLADPAPFIQSNVVGTFNLLEAARILKPLKFLYTSTDEVFGASLVPHKEDDPLCPSNPYSATKAAGEMLVRAYQNCFGVPCIITRTTNMFGKRQHEEKFVPMTIRKIRNKEIVIIHTDADGKPGSRQWIHVSDQASALLFLLKSDLINDTFHIAGQRKNNGKIMEAIARVMFTEPCDSEYMHPWYEFVNAYDRFPGHDLHYTLDDSKIRAAGWTPRLTFEQGLALTV
jgi:dTDP-glucose 4,6-dehydratase